MGPGWWRQALAQTPTRPGPGPYGPLGPPDANGIALPAGFGVREIAVSGRPVPGTAYTWPSFPDGSAVYAAPGGGRVLVVNSETPVNSGGASSITFAPDGRVLGARRILGGTNLNCAGGATPWGTWLSCEEVDDPGGHVWECDPLGEQLAVKRPAMGRFRHEAASVDPAGHRVYLTEDQTDGGFYRFTPGAWPSLATGALEIAREAADGHVEWVVVPDPSGAAGPPRRQVAGSTAFARAEGLFFDSGVVYIATTADDRILAYEIATERLTVLYDAKTLTDPPLHAVDNLAAHPTSGDLFVCEDPDDLQICLITAEREVAPFLQCSGDKHSDSRNGLAGVTFDAGGGRLFFSSQFGQGQGATYEVTGPFRTLRAPPAQPAVGAGKAAAVPVLRVGAAKAIALATLRANGLLATVDADRAGTYALRLTVRRGDRHVTVATGRRKVTRAGRVKVRVRPTRSGLAVLRRVTGTRIAATLVLQQGSRRVTRAISLRRGG